MRLSIFILLMCSLPVWAQETVSFQNDREGKSYFENHKKTNRALRDFEPEEIIGSYRGAIQGVTPLKVCAYDITKKMESEFLSKSPRFDEFEGALLYLRYSNEIDDVVLSVLLNANKVMKEKIDLPSSQQMRLPPRAKMKEMLPLVQSFNEKYAKDNCLDEAYKNLYTDLQKIDKASDDEIQGLFVEAHKKRLITNETYNTLERARAGELNRGQFSLKDYAQKRKSLRLHRPLKDISERSEFITDRARKLKMSRRVKLFAEYSDIQIMLMADLVKKLRTRLESKKVTISIYGGAEEDVETITLEPMERFRLSIKLLRKEMSTLSINHYFSGRTPDYMDLITASYETSLIPETELKELAGLEEIWNPKKSFWDKASVWIRTFSSVATIAMPQPYGFIPALVLVVIEATVGKGSDNLQDETVLF